MPNRKMSRTEVIKAHELLKQHLIPGDVEGFFNYQNDWSDAKVAQEIAQDIQATTIGGLRLELFGKLENNKNVTQAENARIKDLETLVQNLLTCHGELEVKYNKLIDTLCLNEHMNVKHLKTTAKEEKKNA